jgi:hypothetical protein
MTASPLKKFLLPAALLSASIFCTLTLPLAFVGSKPIEIQLQKEPIFAGQLKDIATPYLSLATVISLGACVASVAVIGWRQSVHQKNQIKQQLSDLQLLLKAKEAQLDQLKLDELRLKSAGLDCFLEDTLKIRESIASLSAPTVSTPATLVATTQPIIVETGVPVAQFTVIRDQPIQSQVSVPSPTTVCKAVASWTAAQMFLGFTLVQGRANKPASTALPDSFFVTAAALAKPPQGLSLSPSSLSNYSYWC